jgi:hypothetical protein
LAVLITRCFKLCNCRSKVYCGDLVEELITVSVKLLSWPLSQCCQGDPLTAHTMLLHAAFEAYGPSVVLKDRNFFMYSLIYISAHRNPYHRHSPFYVRYLKPLASCSFSSFGSTWSSPSPLYATSCCSSSLLRRLSIRRNKKQPMIVAPNIASVIA